jgi:hypothetical protein
VARVAHYPKQDFFSHVAVLRRPFSPITSCSEIVMTKSTWIVLAAASVVLVSLGMAHAQGEYRGTPAQQRACRPDVFRLCAAEIPNVRAITACLAGNMGRLSPDCRAVFQGARQ